MCHKFSTWEGLILGNVFSRRRCWEPAVEAQEDRCAWEEVAVSGAAQGLHSCSYLRKLQLTERWTQKTEDKASQKSKGKVLDNYCCDSLVLKLLQDVVAQFCYSWNLQVRFSLLCAICLPPTALFMVAPFLHPCSQTSPLSSLHPPSAASDYGDAQSQDKWPNPLQGLKPTTLAQCLHVEQELAVESVHNCSKADTDFCSQTPDNLCLEEKAGKPDVSSSGLEVLCKGLLETCCRPIQRCDAWPGITTVGLQDIFSPQCYNVTYSAGRTPGWLC